MKNKNKSIEIRKIALKKLKPWTRNPRRIDDDALDGLSKSIETFGLVEPIIWNKRTEHVVGGHQRLKVLVRQGVVETDVIVVDLPQEREAALNLALNNPAIAGVFTDEAATLLAELRETDGELVEALRLGEIDEMIPIDKHPTPLIEDEVPEPPKNPTSKVGDIWKLGDHLLACGDLREHLSILMGKSRWDLLVTDPPYGVSYAAKNEFLNSISRGNRIQTPIEHDHETPSDMSKLWIDCFSVVAAYGKPGASYYCTGPQGGDLLLLLLALKESSFPLRHMLVWAKNVHVLGRCDYHYQHEPIIYGWLEGAGHHQVKNRSETSLWQIDKPQVSDLHPTTKPVELYARAMRNSSDKGEIVCDPFAGSGTAIVAAEQMERKCVCVELTPAYTDVIVERWQNLSGKKAVRVAKG